MKKLLFILPVILILILFYACSDDTVTQNITKKLLTYSIKRVPDTLLIQFEAVDSIFSIQDSAENLQFTSFPKVYYEIKAESGYGSFSLKNNLDSTIFFKMFGGYVSDTTTLADIPWKYVFKTTSFTGKGSIKVVRNF